jgi:hypothetical protein
LHFTTFGFGLVSLCNLQDANHAGIVRNATVKIVAQVML